MKTIHSPVGAFVLTVLACALSTPAQALISNGGFESGFTNWTRADQTGSEGTFLLQTGTTSPVNGFTVPAPPGGTTAAMTDAAGPGSHVLYQDFLVSGGLTAYSLMFSLFVGNDYDAPNFFTPAHLNFGTPNLNQRARVDIMLATADPFSLAAGDILQNLYETMPGDPLMSGYNSMVFDVTSLLQANQGATLRLRFAEVDNVAPFNLGVDNVALTVGAGVPDTLPWLTSWLTVGGVLLVGALRRRRAEAAATRP